MDSRTVLRQLFQVAAGVMILTTAVANEDPTEEGTEVIGNYTITIKINKDDGISASATTSFTYRVFGEKDYGTPAASRATCRDMDIPYTDIADIGRICSIGLQLSSNFGSCSINKIIIRDNNRNENAVFNVKSFLRDSESRYQRAEPLQLRWERWGEWDPCNCEEYYKTRSRTCPVVSGQCDNVTPCVGKAQEKVSCSCDPPKQAESASDDQVVVIPIIGGIAAILVIVVVAAICYSRKINKRSKKSGNTGRHGDCPEIVITPPEEAENTWSPSNNAYPTKAIGEQSNLIDPGKYAIDDVEWEKNDLYVSSRP
ncbi:uncharacterized protein LOC135476540 [Liolophura sinensis]|uniref:uncharacterized protein LOC135476540 n=1 Tax=Liolophura sinensis TaxID=3198878 RepID=UPI003158BCE3